MIEGYSPIAQTAMGTFLTWGATALGAVFCVFHCSSHPATVDEVKSTDSMGAIFIILVDYFFPEQVFFRLCIYRSISAPPFYPFRFQLSHLLGREDIRSDVIHFDSVRYRGNDFVSLTFYKPRISVRPPRVSNRVWLFLVAITVHNIPEGLAVGVAFGTGDNKCFRRNLALGMAIQNVPEGLAVSLPMRAAGYSFWQSFWYGQLSGIVEPLAGILGCITVQYVHPLQPYALGFAAGAMIFVIFDDVIPEAHRNYSAGPLPAFRIHMCACAFCVYVVSLALSLIGQSVVRST
ncbi:unnamed protein product [Taenia asiatica]|uniref:Zinc transporter ZIP11 n=1 Tax=Taenia asiatica TaxID=60517 RepID=A0A0R3W2L0_TAEAS|nr:unnamed protein product [Taenia asiatica]